MSDRGATIGWISPATGAPLARVSAHVLAGTGDHPGAAGERWPVIDDIPFLRLDRRALADAALDAIDAGDVARACALLLTDQDPFAPDPPPTVEENLSLLADEPDLSFRDAMARLRLGRVADYFAHRWSDPTFLSGLALATALRAPRVLELACGAGHFLPALARAGLDPIGSDLVFAKLWLCRRFVAPDATLACFDAARPWPVASAVLGGVFCHDAFYFLPDRPAVVAEMRRASAPGAVFAVGHAHNARVGNHSAGLPLPPCGYAALFEGDVAMFDDAALTAAYVSGDAPAPLDVSALDVGALGEAAAVSLLHPRDAALRLDTLGTPTSAQPTLRLNPLYRRAPGETTARIAWPSPRYEAEYAPLATYPETWAGGDPAPGATDADIARAYRRRVFVELPERW